MPGRVSVAPARDGAAAGELPRVSVFRGSGSSRTCPDEVRAVRPHRRAATSSRTSRGSDRRSWPSRAADVYGSSGRSRAQVRRPSRTGRRCEQDLILRCEHGDRLYPRRRQRMPGAEFKGKPLAMASRLSARQEVVPTQIPPGLREGAGRPRGCGPGSGHVPRSLTGTPQALRDMSG